MRKQHIEIRQSFNAPIETIFNILSDHESFGNVLATKIRRVKDSPDENNNGVGSIRRICSFPLPAFEETVVDFVPNSLVEYVVSKGSPIKNHKGRMEFSQDEEKTNLYYSIEFQPRLPFMFFGSLLKAAIESPIRKSLERLSREMLAGSSK
ncbi:MAG: SRPBCC family protein [Desulfobacterales bacterium]|nr:SRPBCC family protein [Desulfobacterales bacterium]